MLDLLGQFAEPGREIAMLPGIAGQRLQQRLALQLCGIATERRGETRRNVGDAFGRVDLPQPVGVAVLIFAQQQADDFVLFLQIDVR